MRIFGLNRRIIRVLLGSQYAHMLEYRAEIALWALSGVLPFIMLSVWSGSDARSGLGLDVNAQARVRQFLAEYNRRTGATVLLTSHYMADITALCPRVLLIHQGRLFHDGPLEVLADQLAPEREVRLELEAPVSADALAGLGRLEQLEGCDVRLLVPRDQLTAVVAQLLDRFPVRDLDVTCLLYTSPSPRDMRRSRMPSSA